jgi:hypothetical protein
MNKRQSVGEAGPLSLCVQGFREYLEGKGYAPDSFRWRLRQLAALDRWLPAGAGEAASGAGAGGARWCSRVEK